MNGHLGGREAHAAGRARAGMQSEIDADDPSLPAAYSITSNKCVGVRSTCGRPKSSRDDAEAQATERNQSPHLPEDDDVWMSEESVADDLSSHRAGNTLSPLDVLNGNQLSRCLVPLQPNDPEVSRTDLLDLLEATRRSQAALRGPYRPREAEFSLSLFVPAHTFDAPKCTSISRDWLQLAPTLYVSSATHGNNCRSHSITSLLHRLSALSETWRAEPLSGECSVIS